MMPKTYSTIFFLVFSLHFLIGQVSDYPIQKVTKESGSTSYFFFNQSIFGNLSVGVKEEGVNISGISFGSKQKIQTWYSNIELTKFSSEKFLQNILLEFLSYCISYTSEFTCIFRK